MKKMGLLVVTLLLLGLLGCGKSAKDVTGTRTPLGTGPVQRVKATTGETLTLGTIRGGCYENSFFGFGCALNENWLFADEQELAEMTGVTAETVTAEELREQILRADMFFDFYAISADSYLSMNVIVQNMGAFYGLSLEEEDIVAASLENMESMLTSVDMTDFTFSETSIHFAGSDHPAIHVQGIRQELPFYELVIVLKRMDYSVTVTFASYGQDLTGEMAEWFYAVDEQG